MKSVSLRAISAILILGVGAMILSSVSLLLLTGLLQQTYQTSPYVPIWALVVGNAAFAAFVPAGPYFRGRFGLRRTVLGGTVIMAIGSLASAFAPLFGLFLVGRLLQGAGAGLLLVALIPPVFRMMAAERRMWIAAILLGGLFGAFSLGPIAGGLGLVMGTWRPVFGLAAGMGVVAGVIAFGAIPREPAPSPAPPVPWRGFFWWLGTVAGLAVAVGNLRQFGPFSLAVWPALLVAAFCGIQVLLPSATPQWIEWRHIASAKPLLGTAMASSALVTLIFCIGPIHSEIAKVLQINASTMTEQLLFVPAGVAVAAVWVSLAYDRLGPGRLGAIGMAAIVACALALHSMGMWTSSGELELVLFLSAWGVGTTFAAGMLGAALGGPRETLPQRMTTVQGVRLLVFALLAPGYAWIHHSFIRAASHTTSGSPVARLYAVHHLAWMALGVALFTAGLAYMMTRTGPHAVLGTRH